MNPEVFLNSLVNYERISGYKYDLAAYRKFLEKIGSPHRKIRHAILIAGTKGKGSTAAILSSCLIANGYKVGLYTSPHLGRLNERIRIGSRDISNQELAKYINVIKPHIDFKTRTGARTFFEVLTAIAFMHFAEKEVDFAVLEVGLGGRLDATNTVSPVVSAITRIGYDHMNLLGSRLVQIAHEKAGIIKSSSPVVTVHQRPGVEGVLENTAGKCGSRLIYAESRHRAVMEEMSLRGSRVHISGKLGHFKTSLPLVGKHQIENLLIALAVLEELKRNGLNVEPSGLKRGIEKTELHGRFEAISKKPLVIYDVAHNEDSFRALGDSIREILLSRAFRLAKNEAEVPAPGKYRTRVPTPGKHGTEVPTPEVYIVFGCSRDKDISYAVKHIFPMANEVLLVKSDHPRAMEPFDIYARARKSQKRIVIAGSCSNAFEYLRATKDPRSAIVVFGSFYLWNEIKKVGLNR